VVAPHELSVIVETDGEVLRADRDLLNQAIDELVDNAVKYSPEGGPVEVSFAPAPAYAPDLADEADEAGDGGEEEASDGPADAPPDGGLKPGAERADAQGDGHDGDDPGDAAGTASLAGPGVDDPDRSPPGAPPGQQRVGAVRVTVTDQGIGIPEDQLAQLADAFTQADATTTRRFNGLGLGLACADKIVRAHGGRIAYASTSHKGTRVSILVPVDSPPGEEA
jgi:signal transduction histidine kinase